MKLILNHKQTITLCRSKLDLSDYLLPRLVFSKGVFVTLGCERLRLI